MIILITMRTRTPVWCNHQSAFHKDLMGFGIFIQLSVHCALQCTYLRAIGHNRKADKWDDYPVLKCAIKMQGNEVNKNNGELRGNVSIRCNLQNQQSLLRKFVSIAKRIFSDGIHLKDHIALRDLKGLSKFGYRGRLLHFSKIYSFHNKPRRS